MFLLRAVYEDEYKRIRIIYFGRNLKRYTFTPDTLNLHARDFADFMYNFAFDTMSKYRRQPNLKRVPRKLFIESMDFRLTKCDIVQILIKAGKVEKVIDSQEV